MSAIQCGWLPVKKKGIWTQRHTEQVAMGDVGREWRRIPWVYPKPKEARKGPPLVVLEEARPASVSILDFQPLAP